MSLILGAASTENSSPSCQPNIAGCSLSALTDSTTTPYVLGFPNCTVPTTAPWSPTTIFTPSSLATSIYCRVSPSSQASVPMPAYSAVFAPLSASSSIRAEGPKEYQPMGK